MLLLVKLLALALSFMGLCGLLKRWLGLSGTSSPLTAACVVIIFMMLGGMAGPLDAVWWMLFIGGLAGFAECYIIRRMKPDWGIVAVLAAALAYGVWRYHDAYITSRDTISHWAMVAKYLLRTRHFPDDSTQLIYFQSYPLGSAVFIYYVARLFGPSEPVYIVAQLMLNVCAYLPMFGLIHRNKPFGWVLSLGMLLFLLTFNVSITSLQVDSLLAFITIGGTAVLAERWETPKEAMPALLLVIAVLPLIKNSGMLFAALLTILLVASVRGHREAFGRGAALKTALLCTGLILATFSLWELHASIAYAGMTTSKHAVSLQYYSETAANKSGALIRSVVFGMAKRLLHPERIYIWLLLLAALALAGCWLSIRAAGKERALWMKRLWRAAIGCAALYIAWYVLLLFMYIFSMTPQEAKTLASISRYEKTIIACICGGVALFALRWFCRREIDGNSATRIGMVVLAAGVVLLAMLGRGGLQNGALAQLLRRPERHPAMFGPVLAIEDRYDVEPEKSYLVFTRHDEFPLHTAFYAVKYEFYSNDIMEIVGGIEQDDFDQDGYYTFRNTYAHYTEIERNDDLVAVLEEYASQYDYILVCVEDPTFEAALAAFTGDKPVLRAW